MEKILENELTVHTPEALRTSSNNMLCVVTFEPLSPSEQEEVEALLAVAN